MAENEEIKTTAAEDVPADTEPETPVTEQDIPAENASPDTGSVPDAQEESPAPDKKAAKKKKHGNPFKSKKFRYGSLSVVFTILFIAGVIMINVVLNLVLDRFNVEADLTTGAVFSLGEETEEYIKSVNDDVSFYVTAEKDTLKGSGETIFEQIVEYLDRIESLNSRFSVRYVNLLTEPDFSSRFTEDLTNYQLIVQSGNTGRYRVLSISDFMRFTLSDGQTYSYSDAMTYVNYYGYTVTDYTSNAEEQIVSAIMSSCVADPAVVTFLDGYGEDDSTALEAILNANAYVVQHVDIDRVEAVPEETDILVIHGPRKDYSLDAVTKVDKWLSNGGMYGKDLVYIASPEAINTPNLDEFLKEWGLEIGKGFILQYDTDHAYYTGVPLPVMQDLTMASGTIYEDSMKVSSGSAFIGYYVRPVIKLWEESTNMVNTTVASAYGDQCLLYPFEADSSWQPSESDLTSYDVIVEASKTRFEGAEPIDSKIIAVGSDQLFTSYFTEASNRSNGEAALALFDANSGKEDNSIKIVEKSFKAETYQLDNSTQTGIGLTFAVIIPIIIIITGIVVWLKRRRL